MILSESSTKHPVNFSEVAKKLLAISVFQVLEDLEKETCSICGHKKSYIDGKHWCFDGKYHICEIKN